MYISLIHIKNQIRHNTNSEICLLKFPQPRACHSLPVVLKNKITTKKKVLFKKSHPLPMLQTVSAKPSEQTGWTKGMGNILSIVCGMCVQVRVVSPPFSSIMSIPQRKRFNGWVAWGNAETNAKIATSVLQHCSYCLFDKIIVCSDADAHTFASLCSSL